MGEGSYAGENTIVTLQQTIYFPTSTPSRKARLMYRNDGQNSLEAGGRLYLVLDKLVHPEAGRDNSDVENTENVKKDSNSNDNDEHNMNGSPDLGQASPPVVLRWKIEQGDDGWRAWNVDIDGTASDLKREVPTWKMLRGQFVDSDKLFSVPIRSGLDWRRKGYLSCGTIG